MRDNCTNDCSGSADTNLFQSERSVNRQNFNVTYAPKTDDVNLNCRFQFAFLKIKICKKNKALNLFYVFSTKFHQSVEFTEIRQ